MAKKKKFIVTGSVYGSAYLGEFEAATKKEAEQLALDQRGGPIILCHQCSDLVEDLCIENVTAELKE